MKADKSTLLSIAFLAALLGAANVRAAELSTAPIAGRVADALLNCAIQNAGGKSGTARLQIVQVPSGAVLSDTGDQTLAPGAGLTAAAISRSETHPPGCTNGDCPCPNALSETCPSFGGAAYCRFITKESKSQYRAVGCVSSPATDPTSSPSCIEAR